MSRLGPARISGTSAPLGTAKPSANGSNEAPPPPNGHARTTAPAHLVAKTASPKGPSSTPATTGLARIRQCSDVLKLRLDFGGGASSC
ncbi:hypothetical protein N658DRAFT_497423 [Parathielavia hyrcaniae]|uniref:Uncharacterized protein n=1 Tax=Parathielavia hyrcaniae TaxID=113614 RepID=A0AAN6T1B5_9PEZI|nr:hypothetical protein N658DRAFT_497423 [Parathielavia hyrcaniae]